jgi:hypothetical protein
MNKFEKMLLVAFTSLIVCLLITTCLTTPKAKISGTPIDGKVALKTSPIKNADGSVTYTNVNATVFASMKQELAKAGIQVPQGNEGSIEKYGAKIHFKWDNATNLTITIKEKPRYISDKTIVEKTTDFVHACGGS